MKRRVDRERPGESADPVSSAMCEAPVERILHEFGALRKPEKWHFAGGVLTDSTNPSQAQRFPETSFSGTGDCVPDQDHWPVASCSSGAPANSEGWIPAYRRCGLRAASCKDGGDYPLPREKIRVGGAAVR